MSTATLTKEEVIDKISFWGHAFATDNSFTLKELAEFKEEVRVVVAWVETHCS